MKHCPTNTSRYCTTTRGSLAHYDETKNGFAGEQSLVQELSKTHKGKRILKKHRRKAKRAIAERKKSLRKEHTRWYMETYHKKTDLPHSMPIMAVSGFSKVRGEAIHTDRFSETIQDSLYTKQDTAYGIPTLRAKRGI